MCEKQQYLLILFKVFCYPWCLQISNLYCSVIISFLKLISIQILFQNNKNLSSSVNSSISPWLIFFRIACVTSSSQIAVCNYFIKVLFLTLNVATRTIQLYSNVSSWLIFRIKYLTCFFSLKQSAFWLKASALLFFNPF